jgi:predicted DNA-binding transcriptional regulator YafY
LTTNGKVLQFFELERIRKIYFTDKKYEPMEIDLDAYFSDIYGIHREMGKKPVTIKFQVSRGYIRPFIDDPIHHSQVLVCLKHECAIFSIRVVPNIELIHKFLSYGDTVTILTDCEFRDEIVKNLKRSIRNYELST